MDEIGGQERGRLWRVARYLGLVSDRTSAAKRAQVRRLLLGRAATGQHGGARRS